MSRLPCPVLVVEGGIPAILLRRERGLKRILAGTRARGIEVRRTSGAVATATMLWSWWRLLEALESVESQRAALLLRKAWNP